MKIGYFGDIGAWQEARKLTRQVYEVSTKNKFANDYALARQIQRASISIMANIAEGFARSSNKEFIRYLSVARASNSEVQSHLFVACDLHYIHGEEFEHMFQLSKRVEKTLNGFIKYLKGHLRKLETCKLSNLETL